jgi:hypothetical protein
VIKLKHGQPSAFPALDRLEPKLEGLGQELTVRLCNLLNRRLKDRKSTDMEFLAIACHVAAACVFDIIYTSSMTPEEQENLAAMVADRIRRDVGMSTGAVSERHDLLTEYHGFLGQGGLAS